jgi:hypothetical protein
MERNEGGEVVRAASLSPSSPSFLSILLLTTSLPPSFPSSSSLPLLYFSPSLLGRNEGEEGEREVVRRMDGEEGGRRRREIGSE